MQKPFFRNTPYYKLYTNPPYAKISPFGDGEHSPPNSSMGQLMYHFSTLLDDPSLRWYSQTMNAGPGHSILGVVLKDKNLQAKAPVDLPASRFFPGVGLVSLHTNLGREEDDVHFLIHSDPYGPISHAHADANAFTLEAYGQALAIASGYYPWYGSKHHSNWQWESKSSNTITFDGGIGQKKRNPASKGKITAFHSDDTFDYVEADATMAYQGRLTKFVRRVLHIRPGIFVIHDDVSAPKPVQFEWRLHSLSPMRLEPQKRQVTIERETASLRACFLHPRLLEMNQNSGFSDPPEHGEVDQFHLVVSPKTKSISQQFLTLLTPYKKDNRSHLPQPVSTKEENSLGISWTEGNTKYILIFRTGGKDIKLRYGGIETDADMTAIKLEDMKMTKQFLHGGKKVRVLPSSG